MAEAAHVEMATGAEAAKDCNGLWSLVDPTRALPSSSAPNLCDVSLCSTDNSWKETEAAALEKARGEGAAARMRARLAFEGDTVVQRRSTQVHEQIDEVKDQKMRRVLRKQ